MKKYIKVFIIILFIIFVLGTIFCFIDSLRVHADEEPIFAFNQKVIDYPDYSAKVNLGLGYKIIRYSGLNEPEIIKIGTIFMKESSPYAKNDESGDVSIASILSGETNFSGDSGETTIKITTFGDKSGELLNVDGNENYVYDQSINSKLGYSMTYYYDLFEYTGFEDHDKYEWKEVESGDIKPVMTIYDISDEKTYNKTLEDISKDKKIEEISGEMSENVNKSYFKSYKENEIEKVNYVYIIELESKKLKVDITMPVKFKNSVSIYMQKMINSIAQ